MFRGGKSSLGTFIYKGTWANRPTPSASLEGLMMIVTDLNYSQWICLSSVWRLVSNAQLLFSYATVLGAATTSEQILQQLSIPAGLITSLRRMQVYYLASKSGATDAATSTQLKLGISGTTADQSVYATASWVSTTRQVSGGVNFLARSATSFAFASAAQNAAVDAIATATSAFPITFSVSNMNTNNLILSLTATMAGTSDTPSGQLFSIVGY